MTEQTISINSEQSEHESIDALVERANRALQETGKNISVTKTDVYKNNGAIQGLTLRDEDHNCCPTVYNIEELASMSDSDLAAHIENMFNRTAMNIPIDEQLMDRDISVIHMPIDPDYGFLRKWGNFEMDIIYA